MERIVVVGCGYVGSIVVGNLVRSGHEVFTLTRRGRTIVPGARTLRGDVSDPNSLDSWPSDVATVVYCVSAEMHSDEAYKTAYVDGVRNTLDCAQANGPPLKRVLFVSSTGVYAQTDGEWVDESSPARAEHFSGRRLLEGEGIVLRRLASQRILSAVVLRLSGIYGPGRTSLIDSVRNGTACLRNDPPITNRFHRDDCAGAITHLLGLERPEKIYLGTDSEPTDQNSVLCWIADQLGVQQPKHEGSERSLTTPDALRGGSAGFPRTSGARGSKRCSNRLLRESGYELRYPSFKDGFREILHPFRVSPQDDE